MNVLSPKGGDKLQKLVRNQDLQKPHAAIDQSMKKAEIMLVKAEGLRGQLDRMRSENEAMREDIALLKAQKRAEAELVEFRKKNGWTI